MNSNPSNYKDRLPWLVEGQLKGELSLEEKAELAELLDSSSKARQRFVELARFETTLTETHQHSALHLESPDLPVKKKPLDSKPIQISWARTIPWIMFPICLIAAFILFQRSNETVTQVNPILHGPTILVDSADAMFTPSRTQDNVRFDPGSYVLESGVIHLRYSSGSDLVIEGPARFELIDSLLTRLSYGNVHAMVPPTGKGFTIHAPSALFEDVGTEFGLRVERETSTESIFVFDGQVNIRQLESNELLLSLKGGDVFQYQNGIPIELPDVDPARFPDPGTIGYRRWQTKRDARLSDPELLAHFSFEQNPQEPDILYNVMEPKSSPVSDAKIHGARWVSGRWPNKQALLFDSPEDFAELEIEGEYTEISIGAWVFVDRLDNALNAIFDSNGWDEGDIHFQIRRPGQIYTDIFGKNAPVSPRKDWPPVPIGQWVHLLATFSKIDSVSRVFADGELVFEAPMDEGEMIRPGTCRIGNWLNTTTEKKFAPLRSFHGKIDDLAIWSRALSKADIQAEISHGHRN